MTTARYLVGDVHGQLARLGENTVDLIFTSPPFLALRSYLPPDHPLKALEIGSEPTPADYLDALLDVVEACDRVLAPHGTICIELGDTYSGSGGAGGDYAPDGMRAGQPKFRQEGETPRGSDAESKRFQNDERVVVGVARGVRLVAIAIRSALGTVGLRSAGDKDGGRTDSSASDTQVRNSGGAGWPMDKSLCCIPALLEIALAYGFNPLRPERRTPRWRVRNWDPWCRPNPPVGALGDKWRPGTSFVVVACRARDRYFDMEAVRKPYSENSHPRLAAGVTETERSPKSADRDGNWSTLPERENDGAGAPPLDWMLIPTEPYKGAHYATFPRALVTPFVKCMCPERVCNVCGEPSRRIVETTRETWGQADTHKGVDAPVDKPGGPFFTGHSETRETVGWTDCGHDTWRTGLVLDPFAGSGTTLVVATGHGREAIGIDIDSRNADLARERIGMFLTVEEAASRYDGRPISDVQL